MADAAYVLVMPVFSLYIHCYSNWSPTHPELGMEPLAIKPAEVLEELCYFSMNIAKLDINPDGGNFTLGSGDCVWKSRLGL